MDNATYLLQLRQQHSYIQTEILLLEKHLNLKLKKAYILRREIEIISRPVVYRTGPHPLENSPRSLELYLPHERIRFQNRLRSLSLNTPYSTGTSNEDKYEHNRDERHFHRDHYHFTQAHSRIPPDHNEYY